MFEVGAARAQDVSNASQGTGAVQTPTVGLLPYQVNGQATFIMQTLFKFHSPYQGPQSLRSRRETELSQTYTLYLGARLTHNLELYLNTEMARGKGISKALGLAGYTNGEVIRNPTLGQEPYLARYFLRWTIPIGGQEEQVEAGQNQVAGTRLTHRLVLTMGKIGTNDIFDINAYANSPRVQFMNWALLNTAAYDYAADTRGYTRGVALEWIHPDWAVRFGSFQMPVIANGIALASDVAYSRGDQIEVELHPRLFPALKPAVVRLLGYRNIAHMGNYHTAVTRAKQTGQTPDITAVEQKGAVKYGFVLNFEQALADSGATGFFVRYGWNDGATESFAYTECEHSVSLGGQISGVHWHRPPDRLAFAFVQNELAATHRAYLAAGGLGFILGDGRLAYGPEQILETYYTYQPLKAVALSLDYQLIINPGYNQDRGPVSVLSLRLHLEF